MLRYRINNRDFWDKKNSINITSFEVTPLFGDIGDSKELLTCEYDDSDVHLATGDKLLLKYVYQPYHEDDNSGVLPKYDFVNTITISGVNDENKSFSTVIDKYFILPTNVISRQTIYETVNGSLKQSKYVYVYFTNSHYYTDPKQQLDDEGQYGTTVPIKISYDYGNKVVDFDMEYVTTAILRIADSSFNNADKDLYGLLFGTSSDDMVGDISTIQVYRKNFMFVEETDEYAFYYDKPIHRIVIGATQLFDTNLLQAEALQTKFVEVEKDKAINSITDLEKDVYTPVIYVGNDNEFENVYKMVFNLHFREHRGDEWTVTENSFWNGTHLDGDVLKLMNLNNESDKTKGMNFFSYADTDDEKKGWEASNQSDLISYLNLTNNDVRYQKNKVKKSFLRLSFYDSMNASNQNLLAYSTIFLNSGNLFSKYTRHFKDTYFSALNYDEEDGEYVDMSHDMTGIRVNREPFENIVVGLSGDDREDYRLSSQFVVEDKYSSTNSSEGFYLYLWKDNHSCIPQDIYMKVEFNHAGYGRTIPFMMPYVKAKKVKTFYEIVADHNKITNEKDDNYPGYGYGIKKYLRYSYIHLCYKYDKENNRHVYYIDPDTYNVSSLNENMTKNNTITFDLYEAKISNGATNKENSGQEESTDKKVTGYSNITVTLSYPNISSNGGSSTPSYTISQTVYYNDGTSEEVDTSNAKLYFNSSKHYVETNKGIVTYNYKNNSEESRQIDFVTLSVALNGKSGVATCPVLQNAATISDESYIFTYDDGSVTKTLSSISGDGEDRIQINVISTFMDESIGYTSSTYSYEGWLNIKTYTDYIELSVSKNDKDEPRSCSLTFTQEGSGKTITLNIAQEKTTDVDIFNVSPSSLEYNADMSAVNGNTAVITSMFGGSQLEYTMDTSNLEDWCEISLDGNTVTVNVTEENNSQNDRSGGYIIFTQAETGKTCNLSITQLGKEITYIFKFGSVDEKELTTYLPYSSGIRSIGIISKDSDGNDVPFTYEIMDSSSGATLQSINITKNSGGNSNYAINMAYLANTDTESRDFGDVVLTQDITGEQLTIHIKQYGDGTIVIPDFDYLVTRYYWAEDDGRDLDTLTVIKGTGLKTSTNESIDDHKVGYGSQGNISGYLEHGGDNKKSGNESCLITLSNICTEENLLTMKKSGITSFQVEIWTNWYGERKNGNCQIQFIAYKGGTMSKDPNNTYNFINTDGTEVYNDMFDFNTWASGTQQTSDYTKWYTKTGIINYDITAKTITLSKVNGVYGRRYVYGHFYTTTNATEDSTTHEYVGVTTKIPTEDTWTRLSGSYYFGQYRFYDETSYSHFPFTPCTFLTLNSTATDGKVTLNWSETSAEESRGKKIMENIEVVQAQDCTVTIDNQTVVVSDIKSTNYKAVIRGTINGDTFGDMTIIDESQYTTE